MTIGKYIKQLTCFFILFITIPVYAGNISVAQLNNLFKKHKQSKVLFVQRRFMQFSTKPIMTSGYYYFKAPNYLEQRILRPVNRSMVITSKWLVIKEHSRVVSREPIEKYPNILLLTSILKSMLNGHLNQLTKHFKISLSGKISSWLLTLQPKTSAFGTIKSAQVTGRKGLIDAISIRQRNGGLLAISLKRISS